MEVKNSIIAGIVFGLLFGLFLAIRFDIKLVLLAGSLSAIAFGLFVYFFSTSKKVKKQTEIVNEDGEQIFFSGSANHFINAEAVGGRLYLLSDKLEFKSHNFNIQNHSKTLILSQVKEVTFYNSLGIIPNGLAIKMNDGQTDRFIVGKRRVWKEEIEKQKLSN